LLLKCTAFDEGEKYSGKIFWKNILEKYSDGR
jgi:hypothetical protein